MDPEELQAVYTWVDDIPLSRPKKNISRDFSDAVLMAEIVHHYFPRKVELHNYSPASGITQKKYNWQTMHQRVLKRIGISLTDDEIEGLASARPGCIEELLKNFMIIIAKKKRKAVHPTPKDGLGSTEEEVSVEESFETAPSMSSRGHVPALRSHKEVDPEIIREKDEVIRELRATVEILEAKIKKLDQLVRLKDSKISALTQKLHQGRG